MSTDAMQYQWTDGVVLTVRSGTDKLGRPEKVTSIDVEPGQSVAVIGPTGSGKSELLFDIQQMADGDTITGRTIMVNGQKAGTDGSGLVAHLSQKNNFVMDGRVGQFLELHAQSRGNPDTDAPRKTLDAANELCGEPISLDDQLQVLSGGQSRALMIADIAFISDAPIMLIDEIENAGLDKFKALSVLSASNKPLLIATHDPVLILMAQKRLVMGGGAMQRLFETNPGEDQCLRRLREVDGLLELARDNLRKGLQLNVEEFGL